MEIAREDAGFRHMVVALESPFIPALTINNRTDYYATLTAAITTKVSVIYAGRTALVGSVMMVHFATSRVHMVAVLAQQNSVTIVRKMVCFGTLFAKKTSSALVVAYAHPTAHLV